MQPVGANYFIRPCANVWWCNLNTDVHVVCTIKLFYPTNVDIQAVCMQTVGDVHYNYFIRQLWTDSHPSAA